MASPSISVIIPAFNEEHAIGKVLDEIPRAISKVIVVDNGSTDATAAVAESRGATVVREPIRGYGQACLSGLSVLSATDIVVFLDGDYSDFPEEMPTLYEPIATAGATASNAATPIPIWATYVDTSMYLDRRQSPQEPSHLVAAAGRLAPSQ